MQRLTRRQRAQYAVRSAAILVMSTATMASMLPGAPEVDVVEIEAAAAAVSTVEADTVAAIEAPEDAKFKFSAAKITIKEPEPTTPSSRSYASNPPPPRLDPDAVMKEAAKYVGTPYKTGGSTPKGFDCSGFTNYVFGQLGVYVPRSSSAYWSFGVRIAPKDALPGDIVLSPGHVGIYAGNGRQIDSPHPGVTIQFRDLWQKEYVYIRVP